MKSFFFKNSGGECSDTIMRSAVPSGVVNYDENTVVGSSERPKSHMAGVTLPSRDLRQLTQNITYFASMARKMRTA